MSNRASILKQQFLQSIALPWAQLLPDSKVQELLANEKVTYYSSIYTPIVTLWAMVSQVLDPDKSLSQAVKRMGIWLSAAGVKPPSADTGAYCKARQRLPERLVQELVPFVAEELEKQVPTEQQWCGRRVRVLDGTTVLMSDTATNFRRVSATQQSKTRVWISHSKDGGALFINHRRSSICWDSFVGDE